MSLEEVYKEGFEREPTADFERAYQQFQNLDPEDVGSREAGAVINMLVEAYQDAPIDISYDDLLDEYLDAIDQARGDGEEINPEEYRQDSGIERYGPREF
jgi:hypothetical protein